MRSKEQHLPKTYVSNKLSKKKRKKNTHDNSNKHKILWPVYAMNVAKHIR